MMTNALRALALCAVTALAATSCSPSLHGVTRSPATSARTGPATVPPTPAATPYGGLPDPTLINQQDATAVSRAAVTIMWTYDATIDADQGQRGAYLRAAPYLTPTYLAVLRDHYGAVPMPDVLKAHSAYGQVLLIQRSAADAGPDTATTAHRTWEITVTPIGRDGWHGPSINTVAFVTLTRLDAHQPWRISLANIS